MKLLLNTIFLLFIFTSFSQSNKELFHRIRIQINSAEDLVRLSDAGVPVEHGIKKPNIYFESDFSESEIEVINSLGFKYEIIQEDMRAHYKNQNNPYHPDFFNPVNNRNANCPGTSEDYQTPANFNVWPANSYGGFYTYSQLLQELDDMATLYPNLITAKADISNFTTNGTPNNGTTPPIGGNKIQWVKISDNPNTDEAEPEILYTAIHHAREPASLSQLVFFMWYLLENYDTDPEVQAIINNTELYFIPVINPDGYLYNELTDPQGGGFWRKNRWNSHGVDNNRNYDYYIGGNPANGTWSGPGSSSNPNSSTHHGPGPFSEVETQAVKWFVEQHDFVMALNNHTFGELIYYPFGYADVATPDDALYQAFTSELVSRNGYTNLRDFPFSGDSDDFMYGTVGTHSKIFAMTPEIGTSFWPPQSSIENICKDMMYTNLTAANMVGNYATITDNSDSFVQNLNDVVEYSIKRLGLEEPASFTVSVNPVSSNIVSVGTSNSHNNLNYAQVVSGNINLEIDANTSSGELISYELVINNGVFDRSILVERTFGQPDIPLDEPGDNITDNWSTSDWDVTTEDFTSATTSITDSPFTNYPNEQDAAITTSNAIDLTGVSFAELSFNAKWEVENNFDYVQLEISTNNGSSWIPQCGLYTNDGVANQNGAVGEPVYDGFQTSWVRESIDLSDYLDQSILIRFRLVSDVTVREDGFYFDDLQVRTLNENLGLEEFRPLAFSVYPNPVGDLLKIDSNLQEYSWELFSIQGQLISSAKSGGYTEIDMSYLSTGIYLIEIRSENESSVFRLVKE